MGREPGFMQLSLFQSFVETVPAALDAGIETQHRKGSHWTCPQQCVQCLKQRVPPSSKAVLIQRLTKLDYLVNVLLGSRWVVHTPSFYPRAV
jgi:hypothetical protein